MLLSYFSAMSNFRVLRNKTKDPKYSSSRNSRWCFRDSALISTSENHLSFILVLLKPLLFYLYLITKSHLHGQFLQIFPIY